MLPPWLLPTVGFLLGLLLGSFLNVCIARLPRSESVVKPRSRCPRCLKPIRWYDNIPVFSWLILRGRCRDCGEAISPVYPAVELAAGLWFGLTASHIQHIFLLNSLGPVPLPFDALATGIIGELGFAILGFLLIGLMVMDWQTLRLPDAFTYSGIAVGLFLVCTQAIFLGPTEDQVLLRHKAPITAAMSVEKGNVFLTGPEALVGGRVVAVLGVAAILWLIRRSYRLVRGRDGMGVGDIKLMAMIAAFLGFWPAVLALFLGTLAGAAYGVLLLVRGRATGLTRLPFGSFMAAGGLVSAVFGSQIIERYTTLLQ